MHFATLAVFASTLCAVGVSAAPVPQKLYRGGNASGAVPANLRPQDFKFENGQIHPSDKGLSTNKDPNALKYNHLWSVDQQHLANHATLKAVHDGGKNNPGHVSIAHHGAPAAPGDVRNALAGLPWQYEGKAPKPAKKKRDLVEDWDDLD